MNQLDISIFIIFLLVVFSFYKHSKNQQKNNDSQLREHFKWWHWWHYFEYKELLERKPTWDKKYKDNKYMQTAYREGKRNWFWIALKRWGVDVNAWKKKKWLHKFNQQKIHNEFLKDIIKVTGIINTIGDPLEKSGNGQIRLRNKKQLQYMTVLLQKELL